MAAVNGARKLAIAAEIGCTSSLPMRQGAARALHPDADRSMPRSMDYASLYLKRFIFVVALGSAVPALPSASVAFAGAGNDPDESTAEPRRRFESGMAHFNLQ